MASQRKATAATDSAAKKTATRSKNTAAKATKSTATNSTASKSTASKSTASKSTASKSTATSATATKAGATKSATTKSAATKSAAAKTVATKATATKATATKPAAKKAPAKKVTAKSSPATKAPATSALSAADLREIKKQINSELTQLRSEYEETLASLDELQRQATDTAGDDQADTGSKTFEREQEMSIAANRLDLITQMEHAIKRIDAKTYGICENCGEPIPKARLQAFPSATLCVTCKAREERR